MKVVKFDEYGDLDVLHLTEVPVPEPAPDGVVVKIKAAGINPGENGIRSGALKEIFPATFPSGEGTDFAGVVTAIGANVTAVAVGDEVSGYTHNRASHAEYVTVPADHIVPKPENVSWEVAGSLQVAGMTAVAAVDAVGLAEGDTVVVSAAGGGVGSIAVQLALQKGAKVLAVAGAHDADWLAGLGATLIDYSGDVAAVIKEAAGGVPDAFIDASGKGYVQMAIELGVKPDRIDTVADFAGAQKYGVKTDGAAAVPDTRTALIDLLQKISDGEVEVPVAKTFPLDQVRAAYEFLNSQHHRGKVVLIP